MVEDSVFAIFAMYSCPLAKLVVIFSCPIDDARTDRSKHIYLHAAYYEWSYTRSAPCRDP